MPSFWKRYSKENLWFISLICLSGLLLGNSARIINWFGPTNFSSHKFLSQLVFFPKTKITPPVSLRKQNEILQAQINKFLLEKSMVKEIVRENQRLREQLGYKRSSDLKLIPAQIIGHDFTNWFNILLIDKGGVDGIEKNDGVIAFQDNQEGFVGRIIETENRYAKVLLISDPNSQIGGRSQENRYEGIVQGQNTNLLLFEYLPENVEIKISERVVTSGTGSIFPPGIGIGKIKRVLPPKYPGLQRAEIQPALDFNRIEEVFIVK